MTTYPAQVPDISQSALRLQFLESHFWVWMKTRSGPQQIKHLTFCEEQLRKLAPEDAIHFALDVAEPDAPLKRVSPKNRLKILTACRSFLIESSSVPLSSFLSFLSSFLLFKSLRTDSSSHIPGNHSSVLHFGNHYCSLGGP